MLTFLRQKIRPDCPLRTGFIALRAFFWSVIFRFPTRRVTVIGVTGTDGKTTTARMIAHILATNGMRVAVTTTTGSEICGRKTADDPLKRTSLPPRAFQKFARDAVRFGCTHLVAELSSIALAQNRAGILDLKVAVMTNITPEERTWHRTFERYQNAKMRILRRARVIVAPTELKSMIRKHTDLRSITGKFFGLREIWQTRVVGGNLRFVFRKTNFELQNLGRWNAKNAVLATLACEKLGVERAESARALRDFKFPYGRLEPIDENQNFRVFVDFALTPGAFRTVLVGLRQIFPKSKIAIVFGAAGGGRDREKRPELGKIAAKFADRVIVTDDEPYFENPDEIRREIIAGTRGMGRAKVQEIADRRKAIRFAISNANRGDIVLVTGMGAEKSRNVDGRELKWDEIAIVRNEIKKLTGKNRQRLV